VKLPDAVEVVADSLWRAIKAADALGVSWDLGDGAAVSSATISASLHAALAANDARVGRKDGDVDKALAGPHKRVEADYEVPFLAHATMEPQNCTAHVTANRVEVWAPSRTARPRLPSRPMPPVFRRARWSFTR
jgi:isoquinoline 1-oxidoreductase beta subunit